MSAYRLPDAAAMAKIQDDIKARGRVVVGNKQERDQEAARARSEERHTQAPRGGRERVQQAEKPRNKFRNVPTVVDGIKFQSKRESRRYSELKLLEKAGLITDLRVHTKLSIDVNGHHIWHYEADLDYLRNGKRIYEDAKGVMTAVYQLKKKLVRALYGVEIQEV